MCDGLHSEHKKNTKLSRHRTTNILLVEKITPRRISQDGNTCKYPDKPHTKWCIVYMSINSTMIKTSGQRPCHVVSIAKYQMMSSQNTTILETIQGHDNTSGRNVYAAWNCCMFGALGQLVHIWIQICECVCVFPASTSSTFFQEEITPTQHTHLPECADTQPGSPHRHRLHLRHLRHLLHLRHQHRRHRRHLLHWLHLRQASLAQMADYNLAITKHIRRGLFCRRISPHD